MSDQAPFVLYAKRSPFGMRFVVAVCVAILGLFYFLGYGPAELSGLVGGLSFLGFGGIALVLFLRMRKPSPALVVDDQGVHDLSSLISVGRLSWDEITMVRTYRDDKFSFLGIYVTDNDALIERVKPRIRFALETNLKNGQPIVSIPSFFYKGGDDAIKEAAKVIRERLPQMQEG